MSHHFQKKIDELFEYGSKQSLYERSAINLIASDNAYPVSWTHNSPYKGHMIQEGRVGARPFAGAKYHDAIEYLAVEAAKEVFAADHANVQPHSCSQANQAAYHALLKPGDRMLSLGFSAGGHLTHGQSYNFSGRTYESDFFGLDSKEQIDYEAMVKKASEFHPKIIVCGSSAYPRMYDVEKLREVADEIGAYLMLDLSHEAGLIAGAAVTNPVPIADVCTMSLDKTLRGPFGGIILCKSEFKKKIESAVHPGTQSSFSVRRISDSAHAILLTQSDEFKQYARSLLQNAKAMEQVFLENGFELVAGGTEKHYTIVKLRPSTELSGVDAEKLLERSSILVNRQTIPRDESASMNKATGIRVGCSWITSRGFTREEAVRTASLICSVLMREIAPEDCREKVTALLAVRRASDVWME